VAVIYRPATLDDAELASDVMTASYPPLPQDPVLLRYRWEMGRAGYEQARFLGHLDGRAVAYLAWIHGPWEQLPDRHCEVEVWLDRRQHDLDLLNSMWTWISDRAIAEEPGLLLAYCGEDEPVMLQSLASLGFHPERADRVWELDLKAHGSRLRAEAADARLRMETGGIRLVTIAGWSDPDALRKLNDLINLTAQDVPHTLPILPETFEDFERRIQSPDRRLDRWWLALDGDTPVAMSYLRFPPVRGPVWTGYTCTHPRYRGRGIARATKLQSLAQAVELGIQAVLTANDSENAPMLHINDTLGYVRRPGWVEHHKRVQIPANA
jgi:GNAT superfamily N-acetyltransferase